jgi:hypothetical protein
MQDCGDYLVAWVRWIDTGFDDEGGEFCTVGGLDRNTSNDEIQGSFPIRLRSRSG